MKTDKILRIKTCCINKIFKQKHGTKKQKELKDVVSISELFKNNKKRKSKNN